MNHKVIDGLLRPLGITRNQKCYPALVLCLQIIFSQPDHLQALQKEVYMPVSEMTGLTWKSVENVIRRASALAWQTNPERVQELAGYPLTRRPTPGALLEMLDHALVQGL